MGKIIAIANQKGGVGKTTTAINLSSSLAVLGKKILLIDSDPQANSSQGLGFTKENIVNGTFEFVQQIASAEACIKTVDEEHPFYIIPTNIKLASFETNPKNEANVYKFLQVLKLIKNNYDFIIIDCPPSLGYLLLNILSASDSILIPVQCEFFAFEGLKKIFRTFKTVNKNYNSKLDIEGILLTLYNPNQNMDNNVRQQVEQYFDTLVLNTVIYRNVTLIESPSHSKSIYEYQRDNKASQNYLNLANEIILKNTIMSNMKNNLGKSLSDILKEDTIKDVDFIVNLASKTKPIEDKNNLSDYEYLVGLDRAEIGKHLGITYNDMYSNLWMYRITENFNILKKNYLYIIFRNSKVVAIELKRFKLNEEKSKFLLDKYR